MFDIQYFIDKFENIPHNEWKINGFGIDNKHCALGHCKDPQERQAFLHLFSKDYLITRINDGEHPNYKQNEPKNRILKALFDLKQIELLKKKLFE